MAREINRRRSERAEEARYARPAPVPRTRSERQTVNFNAPVVPQARIVAPKDAKAAAPAKPQASMAKAKAKAARKFGNAKPQTKIKPKAVKAKAPAQTGKARARP